MQPHPKITRTLMWTASILAGFVFGLWMIGGFCDHVWVEVSNGYLRAYTSSNTFWTSPSTVYFPQVFQTRLLGASVQSGSASNWHVQIPPWVVFVPLLSAAIIAARLDTLARRRARLGACPTCSYSRAGLRASAPCPECGSPAPGL